MDISSYTQYEQPRTAGRHLTRYAKNGMGAATYIIATLLRAPSMFLIGSATAAAVAGYTSLFERAQKNNNQTHNCQRN